MGLITLRLDRLGVKARGNVECDSGDVGLLWMPGASRSLGATGSRHTDRGVQSVGVGAHF